MIKYLMPTAGFLASLVITPTVLAHGAVIDYRVSDKRVEIEATYDSGTPMANAQIAVYAPERPDKAWLTGTANRNGQFTFTPPAGQKGTWQVKVRQAGHGKILNIPMGEAISSSSQPISPVVRTVMAAVVIGGFVLTALFFSRKH